MYIRLTNPRCLCPHQALLRDQETEQAIEEAEIRNMELQLKKKMFEQVHRPRVHWLFTLYNMVHRPLIGGGVRGGGIAFV